MTQKAQKAQNRREGWEAVEQQIGVELRGHDSGLSGQEASVLAQVSEKPSLSSLP